MGPAEDERVKPLLRRLKALPETAMRQRVIGEQLSRRSPAEVLDFLCALLRGAEQRRVDYLIGREAVTGWVLAAQQEGPVYELLAEVYRLAREADEQGVTHLLMMATPARGPVAPEHAPGDLDLGRLPLGSRKFMARGHDRNHLERLLLDPDPAVVRNLLRNPNLLERDVLKLAARRPVRDEVLREIYASRWGERYAIRLALACNPYTPTDLVLKLLGFLMRRDLRMVANDATLHPLVRAEARRQLQQRRPQPKS